MNHLQMIHMKCEDLFSLKSKQKIFKMSPATNLHGILRVNFGTLIDIYIACMYRKGVFKFKKNVFLSCYMPHFDLLNEYHVYPAYSANLICYHTCTQI